jgi:hypothetical protein
MWEHQKTLKFHTILNHSLSVKMSAANDDADGKRRERYVCKILQTFEQCANMYLIKFCANKFAQSAVFCCVKYCNYYDFT